VDVNFLLDKYESSEILLHQSMHLDLLTGLVSQGDGISRSGISLTKKEVCLAVINAPVIIFQIFR
jgi:hypothetical protein